jgi:hypothetical protein
MKQILGDSDSKTSEMIIGPAIDDAVQYHDKANWIGIMAVPTLSKILTNEHNAGRTVGTFCKYKIPMKNEQMGEWAVNFCPLGGKDQTDLFWRVCDRLNGSNDSDIRQKWENIFSNLCKRYY